MESQSGSNPNPSWIYDVYLSFYGEEDTPGSFVSHLKAALAYAGVSIYVDDDRLSRGHLTHSVLRAIEASRISIIVFSTNYASSKPCLEEMEKIMECRRAFGQIVLRVEAVSDVNLTKRTSVETDKLMTWRAKIKEVSNISVFVVSSYSGIDHN